MNRDESHNSILSVLGYSIPIGLSVWAVILPLFAITGESIMEWWQYILASFGAIATAIIGGIFTSWRERKSQVKENTAAIERLSKKIGTFDNRDLESRLGVPTDKSSLYSALGISDNKNKSLTVQHDELLERITNSIKDHSNKGNRDSLSASDQQLFDANQRLSERWTEVIVDNKLLQRENEQLKEKIAALEMRIENMSIASHDQSKLDSTKQNQNKRDDSVR